VAGGIGLRESHGILRKPVDMRRFVKSTAVASQIGPAKIVNQKDHNIRRRPFDAGRVATPDSHDGGHQNSGKARTWHGYLC
jgi:hypothetical protein